MKSILSPVIIVAYNTYIEIVRNRILYGIVVFAILMIGFSLLLGQLSFAEQTRISMDFGLSSIQLVAVVLSIFVGSTLVSREIEKQTILTLLVKPLSRLQFLLGKALGLAAVNLVTMTGLALVLSLVFFLLGASIHLSFAISLIGILLESLIVLSVTLFFSTFTTPFLVVTFSIGVWLIGNWMQSLKYFTQKSDAALMFLGQALEVIFPNFEQFNWKSEAVYADVVPLSQVLYAVLNAFCWFGLFLLLASLIFRRRDFV